ncbi:MAG: hypothetical protein ACLPX5_05015 [Dissulfurispiraceae bacterium]
MIPLDYISCLQRRILPPWHVLSVSRGDVAVGQTLSSVTLKPIPDGLLCQRIFGPIESRRCAYGKLYRKVRHKQKLCEAYGVEITDSSVRRERFRHITLAEPVVHVLFKKLIGRLLNIPPRRFDRIIQCSEFVVKSVGKSSFDVDQILTAEDYFSYKSSQPDKYFVA